jgi:putative ABC transport system ATP-binding protein
VSDSTAASPVMVSATGLLRTVVQSEGITALVATHDSALLELADSVLSLEDGQLAAVGAAAAAG